MSILIKEEIDLGEFDGNGEFSFNQSGKHIRDTASQFEQVIEINTTYLKKEKETDKEEQLCQKEDREIMFVETCSGPVIIKEETEYQLTYQKNIKIEDQNHPSSDKFPIYEQDKEHNPSQNNTIIKQEVEAQNEGPTENSSNQIQEGDIQYDHLICEKEELVIDDQNNPFSSPQHMQDKEIQCEQIINECWPSNNFPIKLKHEDELIRQVKDDHSNENLTNQIPRYNEFSCIMNKEQNNPTKDLNTSRIVLKDVFQNNKKTCDKPKSPQISRKMIDNQSKSSFRENILQINDKQISASSEIPMIKTDYVEDQSKSPIREDILQTNDNDKMIKIFETSEISTHDTDLAEDKEELHLREDIETNDLEEKAESSEISTILLEDLKKTPRIILVDILQVIKGKSFKCKVCEKSFANKSTLQEHCLKCAGRKLYICDICNKVFKTVPLLEAHFATHPDIKPFKCNICSKRFTDISNRNKHLTIHKGEKPFGCDICKKHFTFLNYLQNHMRTHETKPNKPFECDICHKKFTIKFILEGHRKIHSRKHLLKCNVCNNMYSNKFSLNRHMRIHTSEKPYKCDICEKRFSLRDNLKTHIRIHSGEKPFSCDICNEKFSDQSNFIRHNRFHTDETPYKCKICSREFNYSLSLKSHLLTHKSK